ncbi:salivary peroxidase/catechol oxidase-like [Haliotis cracherodii]|uniref:salivary peroxidase/catechol oxidase-like n=1 Tax=Haliotis cracherodii TaxID=6455 RepID=UPI0039E8E76C
MAVKLPVRSIPLIFIYLCSVLDVRAASTVSRLHYYDQVACGLKQPGSLHYWWQPRRPPPCSMDISCDPHARYRTFDGSCNNLRRPQWGMAGFAFDRLLHAQYDDGYYYPRTRGVDGRPLPSPRIVSTFIHKSDSETTRLVSLSNMFQVWGQFLDHDLTFTPMQKDADGRAFRCCSDFQNQVGPGHYQGGPCFSIPVPPFDRYMTRKCMSFSRSTTAPREKSCGKRYREQVNGATAFADASNVYGTNEKDADALRTFTGGMLKTRQNDMPPATGDNTTCFRIDPKDYCLLAGDKRLNEHPGLSVLHAIFLREHNRIAIELSLINPHWNDERLFQETRKILAAQMQVISYWEWLPLLLGPDLMRFFELDLTIPFTYRPEVNPTAVNSFATASFRYGHSQIPDVWTVGREKIPLHAMFNRPYFVLRGMSEGLDDVLTGMVSDTSQRTDVFFSNGVSDHLFEKADRPPLDLVSLNINRGRDHGLPPYTAFKSFCARLLGNTPRWPTNLYAAMINIYRTIGNVDVFSGAVSEIPLPGAQVGPTFAFMIGLQFHRIKWGDRFWHQTADEHIGFTHAQYREIQKVRLSRVFCDNSNIRGFQPNVFKVESGSNPIIDCSQLPSMDLTQWAEH